MTNRISIYFFLLLLNTSCSYFSTDTSSDIQQLDTIVDFTKVDVSPSFKVCDNLIDEAKNKCFRANMHQQITKSLRKVKFATKKKIDEEIQVILQIDKGGKITLQEIQASDFLKEELPDLLPLLNKTIKKLPTLKPATKRGIPVNTHYTLPVRIQTK